METKNADFRHAPNGFFLRSWLCKKDEKWFKKETQSPLKGAVLLNCLKGWRTTSVSCAEEVAWACPFLTQQCKDRGGGGGAEKLENSGRVPGPKKSSCVCGTHVIHFYQSVLLFLFP
jgi:hypothetical protein